MKRQLKLISVFLAVLMLAGLMVSCTGGTPDVTTAEDTTAEETLPPEREAPVIIENGEAKFLILRSSYASDEESAEITDLYKRIKDYTGVNIKYTEDLPSKNNTGNNDFEILIGDTNRPASSEKKAELSAMDYFIGMVGNKLVVVGGSDAATLNAINAFYKIVENGLRNYKSSGNTLTLEMLKTDTLFKYDYPSGDIMIGEHKLSEYVIRYSTEESSKTCAKLIKESAIENCGIVLEAATGTVSNVKDLEIVIGNTCRDKSKEIAAGLSGVMPYIVEYSEGKLYICGNGLGLNAGVNAFIDEYLKKNQAVSATLKLSGDAAGSTVYGLTPGANIRVMTNNVWKCDNNQDAWKAMGMDCSAKSRSVGFSYVYIAFKPDVICFQEMSQTMFNLIKKEMKGAGLNYKDVCFAATSTADDIPLLYNADKLKLLDSGHHLYTYGNNGNSKGYTWGYFEDIATGTRFICLSTHLWWKSESDTPGSNEWRRQQAAEIVALSETLIAKYNCPMIMAGDLNTNTSSAAYKELKNGGFEDCHDIAAEKTNSRGHHQCSATGYSTVMYDGNYTSNAIDHMLIKNKNNFKVLKFYQIVLDFYWPLSDHMPVIIDVSF